MLPRLMLLAVAVFLMMCSSANAQPPVTLPGPPVNLPGPPVTFGFRTQTPSTFSTVRPQFTPQFRTVNSRAHTTQHHHAMPSTHGHAGGNRRR